MNSLYDLARVLTPTTGTGTMTLGAAIAGFLTFPQAGVVDGSVVSYAIADGNNREVGRGTYAAGAGTLSRDQIYRSTGAGNNTAISLSGGAQVMIAALAEDFISIANPPPPQVDLDFQHNVYWTAPWGNRNNFTFARASVGYIDDLAGNWTLVPANTMRRSAKGALSEEARTNSCGNNSMQGAATGSPGTMPQGGPTLTWGWNGATGLTRTIVAIGTQNGIDYIDIRVNGTITTTFIIMPVTGQALNGPPTVAGDIWTGSIFCALIAGSLAGFNSIGLNFHGWDSGGGTTINTTPTFTPDSTLRRYSATIAAIASPTAYINFGWSSGHTSGAVIDATFRFGWPQLEKGSFASSPIRTTNAALARATDNIRLARGLGVAGSGLSIYAQGTPNAPAGYPTNQFIFEMGDGTQTNRVGLARSGAGTLPFWTVQVGTQQSFFLTPSWAAGVSGRMGFGMDNSGGASLAFNGGSLARAASALIPNLPPVTVLAIGAGNFFGNYFNGYVERLCIWSRLRLDDATLQTLTAAAPDSGHVDINYGSNTNDNAPAGMIGEYRSANIVAGSAVALTSGSAATIATLSLTPGDWDVSASVCMALAAGTTATLQTGAINTAAALPTPPNGGGYGQQAETSRVGVGGFLPMAMRLSLAATTTVYLLAQATFSGGTASAYGFIGARRA